MAHTITRRWAAIVTVTAALLAMAACGKSPDNPGTGTGGDGALGGPPSASTSADPTATDGGNGGGGGGGGGGGTTAAADPYPKDGKAYQQQFLNAFSSGDQNRIADLSNADQTLQANNSLQANGKPNGQWTTNNCTGNNCQWHNAYGDVVSISHDVNKLGQPHAITYLYVDRTTYPGDPASYVYEFLAASEAGNKERMVRLSSTSVADRMTGSVQIPGSADVKDLGGGNSQVDRHPVNRTDPWYSFKVLTQPGGKANAIKSACAGTGCAL